MCYKIASNVVDPQKERGKWQEEEKRKKARIMGKNKGGGAKKMKRGKRGARRWNVWGLGGREEGKDCTTW
jgi:hypothetical protein